MSNQVYIINTVSERSTRITIPRFPVRSLSSMHIFPYSIILLVFRVSNESVTTDDFMRGDKDTQDKLFQQWENVPEKAQLSSNCIDAGFKIRPTEEELKEMGPEFNELWDRYFKDKPDKPVMFGSIVCGGKPTPGYFAKWIANFSCSLRRPRSVAPRKVHDDVPVSRIPCFSRKGKLLYFQGGLFLYSCFGQDSYQVCEPIPRARL